MLEWVIERNEGGNKMKNVMKAAHQLTKEIKNKYPEVDYAAQLGLCMSYLSNETEVELELSGSPKQIAWAKDIRAKRIAEMAATLEAFHNNKKIMKAKSTQPLLAKFEQAFEGMKLLTRSTDWIGMARRNMGQWDNIILLAEFLSEENFSERESRITMKMFEVAEIMEYVYHNQYGYRVNK